MLCVNAVDVVLELPFALQHPPDRDLAFGVFNAEPECREVEIAREVENRFNRSFFLPRSDQVPVGPLALAGAPTIRRVAGDNGDLTIALAPNANYNLRLSDPNGNRGALAVIEDADVTLAGQLRLEKATTVNGTVKGPDSVPGAIVQFLCASCTGIERSRPIAEGITKADGTFSLAVPNPN